MEHIWPTTILVAALTYLLYKHVLYPLVLSPLSKIPPAHSLAPITQKWMNYQASHFRELATLYKAHTTHGPIVRLGPNEVSVVSQEGIRKIHTAGLDKDSWWAQPILMACGVQSLVSTLDHPTHAKIKRVITNVYQKSFLLRSEELAFLSKKIVFGTLMPMVRGWAAKGNNVEIMQVFEWTGVDIVSNYVFGIGGGTDFLKDNQGRAEYFAEQSLLREGKEPVRPATDALGLRLCEAAVASSEKSIKSSIAVKFHAFLSANAKELGIESDDMVMRRCASEMLDNIIATQELQPTTWVYILHHLSQQPTWQEKLRAELQTLHPGIPKPEVDGNEDESPPHPSHLDNLPILHAIVNETLRLHVGNPARLPRVAPQEGMVLHGYQIPPGTTVSTNPYCLHRNAEAFPKPLEWRPERWLSRDHGGGEEWEGTEAKEKWFFAFGGGPRVCIGQHLAMQVIKLVVAAIYAHYTTSIVNDEGIEQTDNWLSGPASHRLIVRFHYVEDAS